MNAVLLNLTPGNGGGGLYTYGRANPADVGKEDVAVWERCGRKRHTPEAFRQGLSKHGDVLQGGGGIEKDNW
jgi:hypothetical protein